MTTRAGCTESKSLTTKEHIDHKRDFRFGFFDRKERKVRKKCSLKGRGSSPPIYFAPWRLCGRYSGLFVLRSLRSLRLGDSTELSSKATIRFRFAVPAGLICRS